MLTSYYGLATISDQPDPLLIKVVLHIIIGDKDDTDLRHQCIHTKEESAGAS